MFRLFPRYRTFEEVARELIGRLRAGTIEVGQQAVGVEVRIKGNQSWAGVWAKLVQAADRMDLMNVRLDVNAPAWHEQYHGRWDRRAVPALAEQDVWRLELPVFGHGQVIGRLSVAGVREAAPVADLLTRLSAG